MNTDSPYTIFMNSAKPARLSPLRVAWMLGFEEYTIPILTRYKLLTPLGNPERNEQRYYALADIEAKAKDIKWLNRASAKMLEYTRGKNGTRSKHHEEMPSAKEKPFSETIIDLEKAA